MGKPGMGGVGDGVQEYWSSVNRLIQPSLAGQIGRKAAQLRIKHRYNAAEGAAFRRLLPPFREGGVEVVDG